MLAGDRSAERDAQPQDLGGAAPRRDRARRRSRPSNRMSGCRLPSPAWKTLATRMPCLRPIASMPTSASPSRLRGTTPSWTMKSGLSRPTAENADLRPFHIASRSAAFCAMRTLVGAGGADQRLEIDELRVDVGGLALELDEQHRRGVERIAGVDGGLRRLDRQVVHDLHRPGQQPGADDARHRVAGGLERAIGGEHGAEAGRPRQQPQRDLERDAEAAFGADEAADEVGPDRIEAAAAERHQRRRRRAPPSGRGRGSASCRGGSSGRRPS